MSQEQLRPALFEQLARVGKAFGNGKRLELIELLAQCPRGVVELAEAAGLQVTTTSAHLQASSGPQTRRAGRDRARRHDDSLQPRC